MSSFLTANPRYGKPGPWGRLREPRLGVMAHFDGSLTDRGALDWLLSNPDCNVSYNWIILDDGTIRDIAPPKARAFHAGACRPSAQFAAHPYRDANSAFYGIAYAARAGDRISPAGFASFVHLTATIFQSHGWPFIDADFRVTDHAREAVFEKGHPRAGQRGRKSDIGSLLRGVSVPAIVKALATYPHFSAPT